MTIVVEELSARRTLLEKHEELIEAAREFGATLIDREHTWDELEAAARHLDDAAVGHWLAARALEEDRRRRPGWRLTDVVIVEGSSLTVELFVERCAGLYAAAGAVAELLAKGAIPAATDAVRSVLGRAAVDFYVASRAVAAYTVSLED